MSKRLSTSTITDDPMRSPPSPISLARCSAATARGAGGPRSSSPEIDAVRRPDGAPVADGLDGLRSACRSTDVLIVVFGGPRGGHRGGLQPPGARPDRQVGVAGEIAGIARAATVIFAQAPRPTCRRSSRSLRRSNGACWPRGEKRPCSPDRLQLAGEADESGNAGDPAQARKVLGTRPSRRPASPALHHRGTQAVLAGSSCRQLQQGARPASPASRKPS